MTRVHVEQERAIRLRSGSSPGLCERAIRGALGRLREGRVVVRDEARGSSAVFGDDSAPEHLRSTIAVREPRAWRAIALGGSVGAGEAYVDGLWDAGHEDLVALVRILSRNRAAMEAADGAAGRIVAPLRRIAYAMQANTRAGARRNIAAHYDLSNEFFRMFLDPTMTYSCGIFEHGARTMEEASVEKLDRACRKLDLQSSDHLLEIGTGWGSMALHAATHYGCRVTSATISRAQAALARERIEEAGLADRIEVVEQDYRSLRGRFDKIVSIEMIEAVGRGNLGAYFEVCDRLLAPGGLMLLQAITIRDRDDARAAKNRDWLKKHIFPGSCLLSVSAIAHAVACKTDLVVTHLEDIGSHYPATLRAWRARFNAQREGVRSLGFDERFVRMWNYYLCYCEGVFEERRCSDVQVLLAGPGVRREPWSDTGPRVPLSAVAPR